MLAADRIHNDLEISLSTLLLRNLSNLISIILIPLLIPVYLFCIILFFFPQSVNSIELADKFLLLSGVFISTILLPFLFVFIIYKMKIISSLTLEKREDRLLPQVFSCICYLIITLFLITKMGITNSLSLVMTANTLSLLVIAIITNFWKISTHASGAMGFLSITGILFIKYPSHGFMIPFLVIIFLSLSVCIARLYLKAHTLAQVIGGCILGTVIGVSVFYFLN